MTKESFLRGAAILAAASMFNRLIGVVYLVILPRLIQDEGMGLFQLVKPLHYLAAVVALAGMPVALSKLVAEKRAQGSVQGVRRVFRLGFAIMFATGSAVALILIRGSRFIAEVFAHDPAVQPVLAILGPACFFLALSAALRGYFQGLQNMVPTAVSQVVDQIVRVGASVFLSLRLRPLGVERAVTAVAWGFVLGEFSGWLVLLSYYFSRPKLPSVKAAGQLPDPGQSGWQLTRRLVSLAGPVVVSTVLWPIMQLADSILIPVRMQVAGYSAELIREGLGHFGMALVLAQLPNIITVALATSLVPAIAEAWALRSKKLVIHRAEEALRVALIFGLPAFAFLYALARPLAEVLFGYAQVGSSLRILALGTVTLGLIQSTTGILQGLGLMGIPLRNLVAGVLAKFALNYVLVANPSLGILGAAWSTTVSWAVVALLNLAAVFRRVGLVVRLGEGVVKPCLATLAAVAGSYRLYRNLAGLIPMGWATPLSLGAGLILYFLLSVMGGIIEERDLDLIPLVGKPLGRFLYDWGFLRK